ncbi:MAG: IS30 family transposase [Deltaproteobacteria bacterium]|nr:IS30 family transposase [Deltaproteobacteria bacterium]
MARRWGDHGHRLSGDDHDEIQRRVAEGETFAAAASAVGCSTKSIKRSLARNGGVTIRRRVRSPLRLSVGEREEVARGLLAGCSMRAIARTLGRAPSTISREVLVNSPASGYRGWKAEQSAARRAQRPKQMKLSVNGRLRQLVERGLRDRWSPQQIAARLKHDYPQDAAMRVSHETIYRSLFVQARGALRKELTSCLRTGRTQRRAHRRTDLAGRGRLTGMVMISDRPAEVEDRAVPGHWEGDLIIGKGGRSAIGTLVERTSRYVVLLHLPDGRTAEHVRRAMARQLTRLPTQLRRTVTWDQGKEMAEHARFKVDTNIDVYFCDPHSPWQRGSNENTNGLLRQYFPKGSDLAAHSRARLDTVARELNSRPRQTLGWMKPCEVFNRHVATTG